MSAPVLEPGERIVFREHPSIVVLIFPLVLLALTYAAFLFVLCPQAGMSPFQWPCLPVSAIVLPAIAAIITLDWLETWYVLTNQRVIRRSGIIGREITNVPLDRVNDVTVRQGIIGRVFGYGDVTVESAGSFGQLQFIAIGNPLRAARAIQEAAHDMVNLS